MNPENPEPPADNPTAPARAPDALRDGDYLVVRKQGAKLPPGCVLCGAPEERREWLTVRKFNMQLRGVVLLLSPVLIIMYLVSPVASFEAGFCSAPHPSDEDRRRPTIARFLVAALVMIAVGFVLIGLSPLHSTAEELGSGFAVLGFAVMVWALATMFLPTPRLRGHYSDRRYLWVDGASPDYLQKLPEIAGESQESGGV